MTVEWMLTQSKLTRLQNSGKGSCQCGRVFHLEQILVSKAGRDRNWPKCRDCAVGFGIVEPIPVFQTPVSEPELLGRLVIAR